MKLNDLIKENRKRNGFTQEQLAEKLKVTVGTVQNWESGRTTPESSALKALIQELTIHSNQLVKAFVQELVPETVELSEEKELKWEAVLPNDFNLSPIRELSFTEEEQEVFVLLALHSKFNANPIPDLLKVMPDACAILNCLTKFGKLKLITNSWATFSYFDGQGEIYSHRFMLSHIGDVVLNWIQTHPDQPFCLYDLPLSNFLQLCRLYELNVPSLTDVEWLKTLVENGKELFSTFKKSDWDSEWIEIPFARNDAIYSFNYAKKDEIKKLSGQLREAYRTVHLINSDYWQVVSLELNDPEYLLEKELHLKRVAIQKEHPDHFQNAKTDEFELLKEEYVVPTQKAIDLINLLSEEVIS